MQFLGPSTLLILVVCYCSARVIGVEVTLDSIIIFKTHEWVGPATVYFKCTGENKTHLPDVKDANLTYSFKGQESWQPVTEFTIKKCKRCGFYEEDRFTPDDVFGEWEFCPSDFSRSKYEHNEKNEFIATFRCRDCDHLSKDAKSPTSHSQNSQKMFHVVIVILICLLVFSLAAAVLVAAYKYYQQKKREQDHARFLKLFDDGDDLDDELGLDSAP